MMRTIALDDELPALQILASFCQRLSFIDLQQTFARPSQALHHLAHEPTDLLLLDINLPMTSGLEVHRAAPAETLVIYTTAYAEYAVESYALDGVDYLLKPFTFERFEQAARKAWNRHLQLVAPQYLHVRAGYHWQRIDLSDIRYVQASGDYLSIHLSAGKPVLVRLTIKNLLDRLPAADFVRVHRSYIVSLRHISSARNCRLLIDRTEIPIGATYELSFYKQLSQG